MAIEREGVHDPELLAKVLSALDLDRTYINELLCRQREEDLAEWEKWVRQPVPMELHLRPFGGVWIKVRLPDGIEEDELLAIEHARKLTAGGDDVRTVLVLNRRQSLTFARGQVLSTNEATPERSVAPFVSVGGKQAFIEVTISRGND